MGFCIFDKRVSMGWLEKRGEEVKKLISGWMVERIREWVEREECYGSVKWLRL